MKKIIFIAAFLASVISSCKKHDGDIESIEPTRTIHLYLVDSLGQNLLDTNTRGAYYIKDLEKYYYNPDGQKVILGKGNMLITKWDDKISLDVSSDAFSATGDTIYEYYILSKEDLDTVKYRYVKEGNNYSVKRLYYNNILIYQNQWQLVDTIVKRTGY